MAKKPDILPFRIFVGDRPIEELTNAEREAFQRKTVERLGNALNDYFGRHPEEYKKIKGITPETT